MYRLMLCSFVLLMMCIVNAQCEFKNYQEQGSLIAIDLNNGFPTKLSTAVPVEISLTCESESVTVQVSPPVRAEEGGPALKGPFNAVFEYMGRTYTDKQKLIIDGAFEDQLIKVTIDVANKGAILPASNNYQYQVVITATTLEDNKVATFLLPTSQVFASRP